MIRIISANLNGIRSATTKGFFDWLPTTGADVLCVQEVKAQEPDLTDTHKTPKTAHGDTFKSWFHLAEKKGYSGVGLYSRVEPLSVRSGIGVAEFDAEGRYVEAEFNNTIVVSVYLPSGSSSEERQAAKFRFLEAFPEHLHALKARGKAVVVCGDWNIAHTEADLKNWKGNLKNSGFLPEERAWMSQLFGPWGWADAYRQKYPHTTDECYTWWSNRGQAYAKNVGWRIDYHVTTPDIGRTVQEASVYKDQKFSDHAPLVVDYDWAL